MSTRLRLHALTALAAIAASPGCIAIKSTAHIAQVEEAWHDANEANAQDLALYEFTLAEQYRLKSHEEWGYSDYLDAENLAKQARLYARQAEEMARYGEIDVDEDQREVLDSLDNVEDIVPEEIDREEDLDDDWLDDEDF